MQNHLKNGVRKGALTEEQVEAKFEHWLSEKSSSIDSKKSSLEQETQLQKKKALELEKEVSATRKAKSEEALAAEEAPATEEVPAAEAKRRTRWCSLSSTTWARARPLAVARVLPWHHQRRPHRI